MGDPRCVLASASPERKSKQQIFPSPKFSQEMGVNSKHVQASEGQGLGLCEENGVHLSTLTCCFQIFLPSTASILLPRAPSKPEIFKLFNGVLRSGNSAVVQNHAWKGSLATFAKEWGDPVVETTCSSIALTKQLQVSI